MISKNSELVGAIFSLSRLMKEDMSFNTDLATLSVLQIQTLVFLKKNPHVQMSEIAAKFAIELPSATSLITKLVKAKLVNRHPDKKDRRIIHIALTEKGEALLSDAMKQRSERLEKHLAFLSEHDKEELLKIISKITQHLGEKNEK